MEAAKKLVSSHESFLLVSHEFTDGDDLGAILALGLVLDKMGMRKVLVAKGGVPHNLLFLPGQHEVEDGLSSDFEKNEVLITLGCGDLSRTGFPELLKWQKPIFNIDHHQDTKMFGTVNVWDSTAAANCELVYAMFENWNVQIESQV